MNNQQQEELAILQGLIDNTSGKPQDVLKRLHRGLKAKYEKATLKVPCAPCEGVVPTWNINAVLEMERLGIKAVPSAVKCEGCVGTLNIAGLRCRSLPNCENSLGSFVFVTKK